MAGKTKLPERMYSKRFEFSLTPPVADMFRKELAAKNISPSLWLRQFVESLYPDVVVQKREENPEMTQSSTPDESTR
jgi:hypothetical protein